MALVGEGRQSDDVRATGKLWEFFGSIAVLITLIYLTRTSSVMWNRCEPQRNERD